ncbi:MAG: polysaccharide lyase 6 family protein [bacterium]
MLSLLICLQSSFAQTVIRVSSVVELKQALAAIKPSQTILIADGKYNLEGVVKVSMGGTHNAPVLIRAEHSTKVQFIGDSRFLFEALEHLTIEGFEFSSTIGPALELRSCNNVRITRCLFHLREATRGSWVVVTGIPNDSIRLSHHNRIDHNIFEKKSQLGNFITIEGTICSKPQVSQYDRIDHNLFADIGPRVENVLEAIRVGSSEYSLSSGFTVIEENLFERCDGDPEYISIKSSDDTIRHNTFRECFGSLSLRHGNRNTVDGNYVLGNGRTGTFIDSTGKTWTLGTGGVRFYGTGMRIINNYFEGLTGKRWDATFAITSGNAEYGDGQPLTKHFRIQNATIAFNTLVNNTSNFEIGYDGEGFQGNWWRLPPMGLHMQNNIIVSKQDTLIKIFASPVNSTWEKNIVWATGGAVVSHSPIDGVQVTDPKLVNDRGIWHLQDRPVRFRPLERKDVGPEAK